MFDNFLHIKQFCKTNFLFAQQNSYHSLNSDQPRNPGFQTIQMYIDGKNRLKELEGEMTTSVSNFKSTLDL